MQQNIIGHLEHELSLVALELQRTHPQNQTALRIYREKLETHLMMEQQEGAVLQVRIKDLGSLLAEVEELMNLLSQEAELGISLDLLKTRS